MCISVDPLNAAQELFLICEQAPIVIQIVQVDFEAPPTEPRGGSPPRVLTTLRNELERRFDRESIVDIHELVAEIEASLALDIVRHHGARRCGIGPEPDERNLRLAAGL